MNRFGFVGGVQLPPGAVGDVGRWSSDERSVDQRVHDTVLAGHPPRSALEPAPTRSWIEALFGQLKREFPNRNVIVEIDVHPNLKVLGSAFCSVT